MINFLHNFQPNPILISLGPLNLYWYGLFMVSGILAALIVSFRLAKYYKIDSNTLLDLCFWLIINGLIGARVYDILLEYTYYLNNPLDIFKIWQGGLAIHGAIIGGLLTIYFFSRKRTLSPWRLIALALPGLALGQALGRWGNYFNQELFGLPTSAPWGIPIQVLNRPWAYISNSYFQPTFLFESLGCLIIFTSLLLFNIYFIKKNKLNKTFFVWMIVYYMISYSILRFTLETIRIDWAPTFLGLRWPQFMSLIIIFASFFLIIFNSHAKTKND